MPRATHTTSKPTCNRTRSCKSTLASRLLPALCCWFSSLRSGFVRGPFVSVLFDLFKVVQCVSMRLCCLLYRDVLFFTPSNKILLFSRPKRAREGLAQPQACRAGAVCAAPCLQVAAGELAAATHLRQAGPLSACAYALCLG